MYNRQPDVDTQAGWKLAMDRITDMDTQVDTQVGTDRLKDMQGLRYGHSDKQILTDTAIWLSLDCRQTFSNRHGRINSIR